MFLYRVRLSFCLAFNDNSDPCTLPCRIATGACFTIHTTVWRTTTATNAAARSVEENESKEKLEQQETLLVITLCFGHL